MARGGPPARSPAPPQKAERISRPGVLPGVVTMPIQNLRDLFEHGLMDVYDAETRFLGALEEMSRDATDLRVRELVDQHHRQSQAQVQRLRKVFDVLHREPGGGEGCRGAIGIIQEREAFKAKDPSPEALLAFDLGAWAKAEHYEVASYTALVALARKLELQDVVAILGETLSEEQETLRRVEQMAQEDLRQARGRATAGRGTTATR